MAEIEVEYYLTDAIKQLGGKAYKFISPGNSGVPDRIVLVDGLCFFVELKDANKKPRPLQLACHQEMAQLGFSVEVISSREEARDFIRRVIKKLSAKNC